MDTIPFQPKSLVTPFLFFTGKGGVGKTSIASATAIQLAKSGKRVLIVSTDPASNLDDVFQIQLQADPKAIPGIQGLYAANLDPEEAARMYREKVVGPYRGILPEAAIANIEEQLSGACTVEIAAFDEFSKLLAAPEVQDRYDHIVLDTAPTGHTLRLLQLPKAWTGFLEDSQHGASCLGPLSGLGDKKDLYAETVAALADSIRTTLILVARPDHAALAEAARAAHELQEIGIQNQQLVLNGLLMEPGEDTTAQLYRNRQDAALEQMPDALKKLPVTMVPLNSRGLTGVSALETMFQNQPETLKLEKTDDSVVYPEHLAHLLEQLSAKSRGVIMTMGKGGVGKTTIAAAIAVGLADKGFNVHLTTTDPAAHLEFAMGQSHHHHRLVLSRIDPKMVTEQYKQEVLAQNASHLDEEGIALLQEDLASPCTEEIAVFRAFSEAVEKASDGFIVLDTAPTGHTLLLLDAAEAYHREVLRSKGEIPDHVRHLLPRLRNPDETDVVIVTLPEATPVLEAERLQEDLRRAGIEPRWWVVNQSWQSVNTSHPVLFNRTLAEKAWLERVGDIAHYYTVVPWKANEPVGEQQLRAFVGG
ncbi:arsenical pump-driving ATPase [Paenibacillus timonensis]|uniref:Arsenical pump-driving ATPase n=1 Tax=Paenibacillus timonensis TaxID=225915 RepID=A0ABW3S8H4_9BACL|nr:arsenical pump-driving ATPase [Paenibacillus timonensis]MCH1638905.1 arsenical pump-driving ATPase [Paenibacillus timonensis]